jgi:alanine racemase
VTQPQLYGGVLTVDLDALASNFRLLQAAAHPAECGATVKADAYGLGLGPVAKRLAREGCRRFFVATLGEGVSLRAVLPQAAIYVFDGVEAGCEADFIAHDLFPVLNSLPQLQRWSAWARRGAQSPLPAALHIDTGMNRLGMSEQDVAVLEHSPQHFEGIRLVHVMTHLACADQPDHPLNAQQLDSFARLRSRLPAAPTSIGNSAATLTGGAFCGDVVRPGIALYGANPFTDREHPLREVIRLTAHVIQVRELARAQTVGYGATLTLPAGTRLATVSVGYADGYLRSLGNRGTAAVAGVRVPVVGRVSMDLITLDVSALPAGAVQSGTAVELLGGAVPIDELARAAGTISYEILSSLGTRLQRVYVEASAASTQHVGARG